MTAGTGNGKGQYGDSGCARMTIKNRQQQKQGQRQGPIRGFWLRQNDDAGGLRQNVDPTHRDKAAMDGAPG
jgi:hypothetical protein